MSVRVCVCVCCPLSSFPALAAEGRDPALVCALALSTLCTQV